MTVSLRPIVRTITTLSDGADERKTVAVAASESETFQVVATASQTDDKTTLGEPLFLVGLAEIGYQFLSHMMDIKRSNLIDKLTTKDVLSVDERQTLKRQKKADDRLDTLLMMLRKKSPAEFDSFLTALSETGQQSVADVVHLALYTIAQTRQNPLQNVYGKSYSSLISVHLSSILSIF